MAETHSKKQTSSASSPPSPNTATNPEPSLKSPSCVNNAFYIATTGRPGPVLIDLPKNIQSGIADVEFTNKIDIRGYKLITEPNPQKSAKPPICWQKLERPIILAGGGAIICRGIRRNRADVRFTDGASRNHLYG